MFLLFSLISYNLLGIFEVNAVFGNWVGRSIDESRPGGSFLSGVFTTLLATPCTAPFMGSALGATIGRPFHESFGIFFFLGLGMAAPFLIFGTSPFLQKLMPRPGPWLNTVKKVFALPMILTAAWIFSLLWNQQNQIVLINLAILAMITLLLVFKASKRTMITTSVIISLSLAFFVPLKNSVSKRTQKIQSSAWKSYSESQLEESLSNGKAVFVDFTADWCVSCQYNKKVVLDTPEILAFFAEKQILLMRADWTDFSPKIGEELKRLKRQGVPVYALYLPGNRHKPILLPEILKKSVVREAIDRYIRK